MPKKSLIATLLGASLLTVASGRINPYLFSSESALEKLQSWHSQADFYRIEGFETFKSREAVTFLYRNSPRRDGMQRSQEFKLPLDRKWTVDDLFGAIHTASKATPAVDSSGIYFGTDLGYFYRISHEGKVLWSFRTEGGPQGIHGTALLDGSQVYFGNYSGKFYCLNKFTGSVIWESDVADAVGSSPLIAGDKIVFSAEFGTPREGYVVALDLKTGRKIWTSELMGEQIHSSPTLVEGLSLIGAGSNNGIYWGIDLETGQTRWKYTTKEPVKSTAVLARDLLCFTSWNEKLHCLQSLTGEDSFSVGLGGKSQSSPAYDEKSNALFVSSGSSSLFRIDLKGKSITHQVDLRMGGGGNRYGLPSPALVQSSAGTWVLMPCQERHLCVFRASDLSLEQKIPVGGLVTGTLSVWEGAIYGLVDGGGLFRLN